MDFYEEFKAQDKGIIRQFDILICKDGALSGKVAMVRNELANKKAMINEHIFLVRCDSLIKQKFVFYFLHSSDGQNALKSKITGSAQGGINQENLKDIKIPLPPLQLQEKIINAIERIESNINFIDSSLKMTERKKEEILNSALKA